MRLLLVEDSPPVVDYLHETLSSVNGIRIVHTAATDSDAKRWLAEHPDDWDVAVIDIFLKEGHGFDVLRACAAQAPGRRAVLLTNYTREPVRDSARALGADAVFDKAREMDRFIAYCVQLTAVAETEPVSVAYQVQ